MGMVVRGDSSRLAVQACPCGLRGITECSELERPHQDHGVQLLRTPQESLMSLRALSKCSLGSPHSQGMQPLIATFSWSCRGGNDQNLPQPPAAADGTSCSHVPYPSPCQSSAPGHRHGRTESFWSCASREQHPARRGT